MEGKVAEEKITYKEASEILMYDPCTGFLHWLKTNRAHEAGDRAGGFNKNNGYIQINICGRIYKAHRVAWLLFYGKFPREFIDHINQVRNDNRIVNLREADKLVNSKNTKLRSDSTSGITGVRWSKKNKHWQAFVYDDKKYIHLGGFVGKFDAACARKSAEIKYGYHENHGRIMPPPQSKGWKK